MDTRRIERVERELRFVTIYAVAVTGVLGALSVSAFTQAPQRARFTEVDVGRINVREADGTLRLVISNKARAPDAIIDGKPYPRTGGKRAGMIFFNDEGNENGGLIYGGRREPDGRYQAEAALLFDQYNQDQTIGVGYEDANGRRGVGVRVWDRPDVPITEIIARREPIDRLPEGPEKAAARARFENEMRARGWAPASRAYFGRDIAKNAVINLADKMGRTRLRLVVDSLGTARIEFLDENGRVTRRIGER